MNQGTKQANWPYVPKNPTDADVDVTTGAAVKSPVAKNAQLSEATFHKARARSKASEYTFAFFTMHPHQCIRKSEGRVHWSMRPKKRPLIVLIDLVPSWFQERSSAERPSVRAKCSCTVGSCSKF